MPSTRLATRSLAALLLLALAVAMAATGAAARPQTLLPAAPIALVSPDATGEVRTATSTSTSAGAIAGDDGASIEALRRARLTTRTAPSTPTAWIERSGADTPAPSARTESTASGGAPASFSGRNKVWIPSLGIRKSVTGFACSSNAYPGNRVYRWGCAGSNNIYLFGHAHSVFKPLHDAYVRGRLSKGMKVHYADAKGRISTYKVAWWKVVRPDKGAFAYASQSRPSMTLQTCVGAKSQYRLVVRLTKVS